MRRLKPSYIFAAAYLTAHAAVLAALALTVWRELLPAVGTYNGTILLGVVWLFSSNLWLAAARRPEERRSGADALNEILDWALCGAALYLRRRLSRTYNSE